MKKKNFTAVIAISAAAAAAFVAVCSAVRESGYRAESASDVAQYLSERGITAVCPTEKEITVPSVFGEVYERYNDLQKESGFDLSRHRGHSATVYTFIAAGYTDAAGEPCKNAEVHVIVCDGKIVGGDISTAALDGFMVGLPKV